MFPSLALPVFSMLRRIPGDPATMIAGTYANPEVVAAIRADLGLEPLLAAIAG